MHIIYHCFGGAHSSVTAAAIHLGILSREKIPSKEALLSLPHFDIATNGDHGFFRYLGLDKNRNSIYIIGRRGLRTHFTPLVTSFASLFKVQKKDILVVDVIPYVNWLMILGGFTSRRLGWTSFGRPIVIKGTQKAYFKFVELVDKVTEQAKGRSIHGNESILL